MAAAAAIGVNLGFAQAYLFAAAVNLATAIPAGPAYVGTFELAAVAVAVALSIPPVDGLAIGLIVHVATLVVTTLGGLAAMGMPYVAPNLLATPKADSADALALVTDAEQEGMSATRDR